VIRSRPPGRINSRPRRSAAGGAGGGSQSAQAPPGPGPQGRAAQSSRFLARACDPSWVSRRFSRPSRDAACSLRSPRPGFPW